MSVALLIAPAAGLAGAWSTRRLWVGRPRPPIAAPPPRSGVLLSLGRALQRRIRPLAGLPPQLVGGTTLVTSAIALVDPVLAGLVAAVMVLIGVGRGVAARRRRRRMLQAALPATFEVLRMAVASGLTLTEAIEVVAREVHDAAGEVFGQVAHRHRRGESLADALISVATRIGDPAESVLVLLATTHRSGAAVGDALERMGTRQRAALRRDAEARARRLPVALLLPLVCCVLPSFALLTIVPVLVSGVTRLHVA